MKSGHAHHGACKIRLRRHSTRKLDLYTVRYASSSFDLMPFDHPIGRLRVVLTRLYIKSLHVHSNSHIMDTGPGAAGPHADHIAIANVIASFAAVKIQETHDRLQITAALLQPYLDDLNILHQRHRFIDVPRVVEAREGLVTAKNLLNIARFRLDGLHAILAPGLAWTPHDVYNKSLTVHAMLHRADAVNRDNLHLFHLIDGPNNHRTGVVFGNTVNRSGSQSTTWR